MNKSITLNENLTKEQWEDCYKIIKKSYIDGLAIEKFNGEYVYNSFAVHVKDVYKTLKTLVNDVPLFVKTFSDDYHDYPIYNMAYIITAGRERFEDGFREFNEQRIKHSVFKVINSVYTKVNELISSELKNFYTYKIEDRAILSKLKELEEFQMYVSAFINQRVEEI